MTQQCFACHDGLCMWQDVDEALQLGYVACGAGGFFGEKRRTCLTEFSLAAKVVKAVRDDGKGGLIVGHTGKLGDATNASGSWADYDVSVVGMPSKFIVSAEAQREALWQRMLRFGQLGDKLHDRVQGGGEQLTLLCKVCIVQINHHPCVNAICTCSTSIYVFFVAVCAQADATRLVGALRRLCESKCLSDPRYSGIAQRLSFLVSRIETAAAFLPEERCALD